MTRRAILRTAILVVVGFMLAAAGMVIYDASGPPPHLRHRLPPRSSLPARLNAEQWKAINECYSRDPRKRVASAFDLWTAKVPEEVTVPCLIALLADNMHNQQEDRSLPVGFEAWIYERFGIMPEYLEVSSTARESLWYYKETAMGALIDALASDPDPGARQCAAGVLESCEDFAAADALARAMRCDANEDVRTTAASGLCSTMRREAARREKAGEGPGLYGQPYLEAFYDAFDKEPSAQVRQIMVINMWSFRVPETAAHIVKALVERPEGIHEILIDSLKRDCRGAGEMDPLIEALKDDRPSVRQDVGDILRNVTGQRLGNDAAAWRAWWEANKATFVFKSYFDKSPPSPQPAPSAAPDSSANPGNSSAAIGSAD